MAEARPGGPWQRGSLLEHGVVQWSLPARPTSVRVARRLVPIVCRLWHTSAASDSAALAVSELMGNVVRAGGTEVTVRLSWTPRRLRLEVCDTVPGAPVRRTPEPDAESGRGLWLVSQTAVRWGTRPWPRGKCVWAEFALPQVPARSS